MRVAAIVPVNGVPFRTTPLMSYCVKLPVYVLPSGETSLVSSSVKLPVAVLTASVSAPSSNAWDALQPSKNQRTDDSRNRTRIQRPAGCPILHGLRHRSLPPLLR